MCHKGQNRPNPCPISGQKKPFIRNVFTLKSCAPIAGSQTMCFEHEGEMLLAWRKFMSKADPDVITGYNINNFDIPYLLDRAEALKVDQFPFWGRIKSMHVSILHYSTWH